MTISPRLFCLVLLASWWLICPAPGRALAASASAEPEIIPAERRVVWAGHVGIPGGIPERKTVSATIDAKAFGNGAQDATAAIQGALDKCPPDQVVLLSAGAFKLTSTLRVGSHRVLRGAGPGATTLRYEGPAGGRSAIAMAGWPKLIEGGSPVGIVAGATKGSTKITVAGAAGPVAVGDLLLVDQLNDGQLVDSTGFEGKCTYAGRAGGDRTLGQLVEVTALKGNEISFNIPLYWTYRAELKPQASFAPARSFVHFAGLEDLKLTQPAASVTYLIEMQATHCCWLRNVEVERVDWRAVWMLISLQNEIRDCYFHESLSGYGRSHGYGVLVDLFSSANLVENNVLRALDGGFLMTAGGAAGNVFGYNYGEDSRFDDPWWLTSSPSLNHSPHPLMNLWEGNVGYKIEGDFIHGSSSHNTVFRSRSLGWMNATTTSRNNAVEFAAKNTNMNIVGCVLGTEGRSNRYEVLPGQPYHDSQEVVIWVLGVASDRQDPEVAATLLRHGNYDYVNKKTTWDPKIAARTLPPSLYLDAKPAWFGETAWPPIGPDVEGLAQKIPAQLRAEGLPKLAPQSAASPAPQPKAEPKPKRKPKGKA